MKQLNILGYRYSLDMSKGMEEMNGNVGFCHFDKAQLDVANDLPDDMRNSTILHEIMEAINYHMEVGMTEAQVKQMEVGLHQVLNDNNVNLNMLVFDPFYVGPSGVIDMFQKRGKCKCEQPHLPIGGSCCETCGGIVDF